MSVKKIVKVMNFHSLLRVNNARKKVEQAHSYEQELKKVISSIVNNHIFIQEHVSLDLAKTNKALNIYIGSDFGFCSSFNIDVLRYIKQDDSENDKIIVGKKINVEVPNKVLYLDKEKFVEESNKIFEIVLNGVLNKKYSKINIIYIHYYNLNRQEILKRTILPFDFDDKLSEESVKARKEDDFSVEGDLMYIIWNLISIYVSTEIKIAEAWSWASENVKRQAFTSESLKKIDEREIEQNRIDRKARKKKEFEIIIESNNKKIANLRKEE
ncbi:MAG: F0F1 ATP synthase subunit gamma [Bacilli bacterium]|nr:F0F1 ATP synthase subunit gamma [Bacilli bacterium]